ncbi:MAG: prepilin peptidase [Chlamydiae bacterium]|nr:prepilin peptidase [Chlamydiota bacterium]MBI3277279.1 prepilin peptidase [Chlamydiota bacterium]
MILILLFLGACIGSFLNVCIYRLPRERSIITPRSYCPRCSRTISWYDNIPIISYLNLSGRCRFCEEKISFRYPLVESISSLLTLWVWNESIQSNLTILEIVARLLLTYALIVVTVIDWDFYIIPDGITYLFLFLAVVLGLFFPSHLHAATRLDSLGKLALGIFAGAGSLWFIGWLGKIFMKKDAMGLGDVKLMGMVGAWLGWKAALCSIMLASIMGSIFGIAFIIFKKLKMESRIPFGPFLSMGVFIFMMWGDCILDWYMSFLNDFRV